MSSASIFCYEVVFGCQLCGRPLFHRFLLPKDLIVVRPANQLERMCMMARVIFCLSVLSIHSSCCHPPSVLPRPRPRMLFVVQSTMHARTQSLLLLLLVRRWSQQCCVQLFRMIGGPIHQNRSYWTQYSQNHCWIQSIHNHSRHSCTG